MKKRIVKSERYLQFQQKTEALICSHRTLWEIDEEIFSLTCYSYGSGQLLIAQNFYDGSGIFHYIQTHGNKWDDVALAIAKSLNPEPIN